LGNGKRINKIVTVVSIVASLCVYALMGISGYTLSVSIAETVMGLEPQEGEEQLEMTIDPDGGVTFTLLFNAHNPGLMEVSVALDFMLLSADGEVIAEGSDSKRIPSGSSDELVVSLHVSPEDAVMFVTSPPVPHLHFECRTLSDLIGMAISVEMGGG